MPKKTIRVTQDHIDAAEAFFESPISYCQCCPIALALADMGYADSEVGTFTVEVFPNAVIDLPPKAQEFIKTFDNTRQAKPFSFDLDLPW